MFFKVVDCGVKPRMSISRIPIKIFVENLGEAKGVLKRLLAPRTVDAITRILPIEGRAALLNGGIYFEIPLRMGGEKPRGTVKRGDLAYWPLSQSFCIFFKDTRPHTPVNLIGQIVENMEIFSEVKSGAKIRVEKL